MPHPRLLARTSPLARTGLRAWLLVATLLAGCTPELYAITTTPPGRAAALASRRPLLHRRYYSATLSAGVAMAFGCSRGGPCRAATATSDDPEVVRVVAAHLAALEGELAFAGPTWGDHTAPTAFVLVGVRPGATWVRLRSRSGDARIRVTVIEDPPVPPALPVARR
jgi:hypothetical protein